MNLREIYGYYSRPDIQEFFMRFSRNREVVGVFRNGSYSRRPCTLVYPQDIIAMAREGSLEFHSSIERWSQPMSLRPDNYETLRTGWDVIFDLDCSMFEHGRIAARALAWALEKHGIRGYSVKFTGGTGFHVGIPWESLPSTIDYRPSLRMFPDLPRGMGLYLKEYMRDRLERELLKAYRMEQLAEQTGKSVGEISGDRAVLDPFKVVELDTVLISPRHLFRMPYSLNKNTFLVSLPVKPGQLDDFRKEDADPLKHEIRVKDGFLDSSEANEAEMLVAETIDWLSKRKAGEERRAVYRERITEAVPEELFPPCMKSILEGLPDGRKRSVFILATFLRSVKWGWPETENLLSAWNQRNKPPLKDNYVRGQVRWHKSQKRDILLRGAFKDREESRELSLEEDEATRQGKARTEKKEMMA
jgi:DNA primase catalytic subunit